MHWKEVSADLSRLLHLPQPGAQAQAAVALGGLPDVGRLAAKDPLSHMCRTGAPFRDQVSTKVGDCVKNVVYPTTSELNQGESMALLSERIFESTKRVLESIDIDDRSDIYVVSLWTQDLDDDPRIPTVTVGFNTETQVLDSQTQASNEGEARWNYTFWLQNQLAVLCDPNGDSLGHELTTDWIQRDLEAWYADDDCNESADMKSERITAKICGTLDRHCPASSFRRCDNSGIWASDTNLDSRAGVPPTDCLSESCRKSSWPCGRVCRLLWSIADGGTQSLRALNSSPRQAVRLICRDLGLPPRKLTTCIRICSLQVCVQVLSIRPTGRLNAERLMRTTTNECLYG
jgi:hypothetical protein